MVTIGREETSASAILHSPTAVATLDPAKTFGNTGRGGRTKAFRPFHGNTMKSRGLEEKNLFLPGIFLSPDCLLPLLLWGFCLSGGKRTNPVTP